MTVYLLENKYVIRTNIRM